MRSEPPQTFSRIVVATDFSPCAAAALEWAIELARAHRARLDVVYAIETMATGSVAGDYQAGIERSLAKLVDRARQRGVEAASRYRVGWAWEVVAEVERQLRPDLVVVGARGRTPAAHSYLGSRADRMMRTLAAPILTVHATDQGRPSSIRTVIVATDFSEEAALAAAGAVRLVRALPGRPRLVLLHAWQPLAEFEGIAMMNAALVVRLQDTMPGTERLLEQVAAPLRGASFDVQTVVRPGDPATVIAQEAHALSADMVAVGTHGRCGLKRLLMGSVAERVVQQAPCPVLIARHPGTAMPAHRTGGLTTTPAP